jgi:hypothetical protein
VVPVPDPPVISLFQAGDAGFADGVTAALVLVDGSDVADGLVETDGVVANPDPF